MAYVKKVTIHASGTREFGTAAAADTNTATYATVLPSVIQSHAHGLPPVNAKGFNFFVQVNGRANGGNASAATLLCYLEHKNAKGDWIGIHGSTSTPIVTATAYLETIMYPGIDRTAGMDPHARIDLPMPSETRAVVFLIGSSTATPNFAFESGVELYE